MHPQVIQGYFSRFSLSSAEQLRRYLGQSAKSHNNILFVKNLNILFDFGRFEGE